LGDTAIFHNDSFISAMLPIPFYFTLPSNYIWHDCDESHLSSRVVQAMIFIFALFILFLHCISVFSLFISSQEAAFSLSLSLNPFISYNEVGFFNISFFGHG
jgi:hypothetical protein